MGRNGDEIQYSDDERRFSSFVETVSPLLINHPVIVKIVNDGSSHAEACIRFCKESYELELNLAYHDVHEWESNYEVIIHELAHHKVQSNDHLCREFYDTVNQLGAKMVTLALNQLELFPENYRKIQTSRYAKTSFLQGEDAFEMLGRTKAGFAPYRPYPFFRRLAPWPCGSVAGAFGAPALDTQNSISLLIEIAVQKLFVNADPDLDAVRLEAMEVKIRDGQSQAE